MSMIDKFLAKTHPSYRDWPVRMTYAEAVALAAEIRKLQAELEACKRAANVGEHDVREYYLPEA